MNPRQACEGVHTQTPFGHGREKKEVDQTSDYELPREDRWLLCLGRDWRKVGKESNRGGRGRGTRQVGDGLMNSPLPHPGVLS